MISRLSDKIKIPSEGPWRSVIRIFAITLALLGLVLMFHEILENVWCIEDHCKIHLSTMMWGLTLLSFGLLILQKGDVSVSLTEIVEKGSIVRGWWPGRRSDDPKGTIVTVIEEKVASVVVTAPTDPTSIGPVTPPKPDDGG